MANRDNNTSAPDLTYTLEEFVSLRLTDQGTYYNFSILEKEGNLIFTDHNLIDDYIDELEKLCVTVTLSDEDLKKYRYSPDLLAFDVYGSVQLDFIIMAVNDMIDPKEFNIKTIKLPYNSILQTFLSDVMTSDSGYIAQNRADYQLQY